MSRPAIYKILGEKPSFQLTLILSWVVLILYLIFPVVNEYKFMTLHKVLKSGEITVITRNSPHCYYTYRDQPTGFEYDLAKAFADYLGVELVIKIADSWEEMVPTLRDGTAAIIAAGMTITPKRQTQVAFSDGYLEIQQHLIVHRNNGGIKEVQDLSGKAVHVRRGSSYHERLEALQEQGYEFGLQLHDEVPTEDLIQKVADGDIDITVADNNIALLNRRYFPGAIIAGPINDKENLGWAVNAKACQLLESINTFFDAIKKNGRFEKIYDKYYADLDDFDYVDLRKFHRRLKTRLPSFSPFIKAAAEKHNFDWRLIAAQIYQESHLNPNARSFSGAKGLMQLLPRTARSLGVQDIYDPLENIGAGVQHLKNLYDYFEIEEENDRMYIALAAYNIGQGHIRDAQKLARQMNLDPNKWVSLTKTLPLLRYKKYYKNSEYGYCQGTEPLKYIKQIMIYYDILKRQGAESAAAQASS
ncbi:MAG: membrane-bound lytic murein transglycosylase MltF [Desulfobacterales bacterium]|nr:MAG: membrane-bound lytic murein transglycosylase MltF [Desulfobacterales bacterium]